jgi:hypothetical protein
MNDRLIATAKKRDEANAAYLDHELGADEMLQAKTAHTVLLETLNGLTEHSERIKAEIDSALAVEKQAGAVERMKQHAKDRKRTFDGYSQARQKVSDAVGELLKIKAAYHKSHEDFVGELRTLIPEPERYPAIPNKLKPQFEAVIRSLEEAGLPREDFDRAMITQTFPTWNFRPSFEQRRITNEERRQHSEMRSGQPEPRPCQTAASTGARRGRETL